MPPLRGLMVRRLERRRSPGQALVGRLSAPPVSSPITPGVATIGKIGVHSIGVSSTAPSGGTAPYTYQWQYNWPRGGATWVNATGPGTLTLAATIEDLGPTAYYQLRLQINDSASQTAYTSVVTARTQNLRWYPQLNR